MEDQAEALRNLVGRSRQSVYAGTETYPVLVLASALARTGKSHIARNLAFLLSRTGNPVFCIDGSDRPELAAFLESRRNPPASSGRTASQAPAARRSPDLPCTQGYILVDFSGGIQAAALDCIALADETLLVARPDTGGIREAAGFLSLLASAGTCTSARVGIVMNPVNSGSEARSAARTILSACPPGVSTLLAFYRGFVLADTSLLASPRLPPPEEIRTPPAAERDPGSPHSLSLRKLADDLERSLARHAPGQDHRLCGQAPCVVVSELDCGSGLGLL